MTYQVLEVTLISAKDLKKVTLFSKMRVYVVASISGGDPRLPTHRTYADRDGGRNPVWHAPLRFTIPPAADPRGLSLHVLLRTERAFGDRDVGEVYVPVQDLAAASPAGGAEQRHLSYQVRRPVSGHKRGVLHISYRLTDAPAPDPAAAAPFVNNNNLYAQPPSKRQPAKVLSAVTAYPVSARAGPYHQAASAHYAYPPHQQQPYGYSGTYGYAGAAPYGYGQGAGRQGDGMGAGLGLGLLGGAVGGLMLGDMIADAEVDAAYDGGFMDGAGC